MSLDLHENESPGETRRLFFKQRQWATQKWPIGIEPLKKKKLSEVPGDIK